MKDQIDFLQRRGIEAARLDSSLDVSEQREIGDRLRSGALKLLYVAPERFNNERFLAQLARKRRSGEQHEPDRRTGAHPLRLWTTSQTPDANAVGTR